LVTAAAPFSIVWAFDVMANVDYRNNVGVGGYSLEREDLPARAPSHRKHCNLTHGPVLPMKFAQPVRQRYHTPVRHGRQVREALE
jgi:hypothetical protein